VALDGHLKSWVGEWSPWVIGRNLDVSSHCPDPSVAWLHKPVGYIGAALLWP